MHNLVVAVSIRVAMTDFTFSDGTVVPKGCNVAVAARAINHDEVCNSNFSLKVCFYSDCPFLSGTILTLKNFKASVL